MKNGLKDLASLLDSPKKKLATPAPASKDHPGDGTEGWVVTAKESKKVGDPGPDGYCVVTRTSVLEVVHVQSALKCWDIKKGDHWVFRGLSAFATALKVLRSNNEAQSYLKTLDPADFTRTEKIKAERKNACPNHGWMDRDRPW